jgi:hypothetical protein
MNREKTKKEAPFGASFLVLKKLVGQLPDGGAIGYPPRKSAEIDHIVHTGGATIGAVAAPHARVRIEPQAGSVIVVEGTASDERILPARGEDDARVAHLVERETSSLDALDQPGSGGNAERDGAGHGFGLAAQKGKKGGSVVEGSDGRGMEREVKLTGGVERGSDGTHTVGLELAAATGGGREVVGEEEEMDATRGALGEGGDGRAVGGAPALIRELVVPIGDDQASPRAPARASGAAEEDGEVGVGVEKPRAGAGDVGDVGLVRAVAGLEVFGLGLEGQEQDAEGEPPAGAAEAGQTEGLTLGRREHGHSYSMSAIALRTEASSMTDF